MENNGSPAPSIQIACSKCGNNFTAPLPPLELANNLRTSLVMGSHEKLIRCAQCQQSFVFIISSAQLQWAAMAVDDAVVEQMEGSKIIKPKLEIVH